MKIGTKKTIEKCPYTSFVTLPPLEPHIATFYKFTFVERGECVVDFYRNEDEISLSQEMKENDAFIVRAFEIHSYRFPNGNKNYLHRDIYLDEKTLKECCEFLSPTLFDEIAKSKDPLIFKLNSPTLIYLTERCGGIMGEEISPERSIQHKMIVTTFLSHYLDYKNKKTIFPVWISDLLRKLNQENFVTLSIEKMVKYTNYSHGYVNREFKKYLGISLKQYSNNKKLELSSVMLVTSNISLQEIVERLGFTTLSNFINVFKAKYGITPAKYRKIQSKDINLDTYVEWGGMIESN